jgi:diaminopimelate epimerase
MGKPHLERSSIPMKGPEGKVISEELEVDGEVYKITAVSMGNPHCVIFVDELEKLNLKNIGPQIETHPAFPQKTNVEFVKVEGPDEVTMRVWERGAGETMACGTGACAAVVAGVLNNKIQRKTRVNLPGGVLLIEWSSDDGRVYMTGPATQVFEGRLTINL